MNVLAFGAHGRGKLMNVLASGAHGRGILMNVHQTARAEEVLVLS